MFRIWKRHKGDKWQSNWTKTNNTSKKRYILEKRIKKIKEERKGVKTRLSEYKIRTDKK